MKSKKIGIRSKTWNRKMNSSALYRKTMRQKIFSWSNNCRKRSKSFRDKTRKAWINFTRKPTKKKSCKSKSTFWPNVKNSSNSKKRLYWIKRMKSRLRKKKCSNLNKMPKSNKNSLTNLLTRITHWKLKWKDRKMKSKIKMLSNNKVTLWSKSSRKCRLSSKTKSSSKNKK